MLIRVYQSGGFAGGEPISLGGIDTADLPAAEQDRVSELTRSLERPQAGSSPIGADMLEYRIEVSDDGDERSIVVADDMDPDNPVLQSVRQLLEIVQQQS